MVKVTDADREAAETCRKMTAEWQRHFLAEAFARHRIAGAKAGLEAAANFLERETQYWPDPAFGSLLEYVRQIRNINPEECE